MPLLVKNHSDAAPYLRRMPWAEPDGGMAPDGYWPNGYLGNVSTAPP